MDYILVGRRPYIDVNVRKEDMDVVCESTHADDIVKSPNNNHRSQRWISDEYVIRSS